MTKVNRLFLTALFGLFILFTWALLQSDGRSAGHSFVYDALLKNSIATPPGDAPLVIITLDDISLRWMEQKWPWHRGIYAQLLKKLYAYGPKVIALDLIFSEKGGAEEDRALNAALTNPPVPVVLAQNFSFDDSVENIDGQRVSFSRESLENPIFPGDYGFINLPQEQDGAIRYFLTYQLYNGVRYRSFPLAIAENALGKTLLTSQKQPIAYQGPPGTFRRVSFFEVFQNPMDRSIFQDKIVLLGPTFAATNDFHLTPYSFTTGEKTSGIEIFAHAIQTLLRGIVIAQTPVWIYLLLLLFFTLGFFWCFFSQKSRLFVLLSSGGFLLFLLFAGFLLFRLGHVFFFSFSLLLFPLFASILYIFFIQWIRIQKLESTQGAPQAIQVTPSFYSRFALTRREKEIIELIIRDMANPEISKKLFISLSTVKKHINHIYEKCGCNSREEFLKLLTQL